MRIAIIDSGIDIYHKRLVSCRVSGISIIKQEYDIIYSDDFADIHGHGTGVASIIYKMIPSAELVAIKIFHDGITTSEDSVIEAINWCCNNAIDVINMSLGIFTSNPKKSLHEACQAAIRKNIAIVAAAGDNLTDVCYPAFFPEVFGVYSGNVQDKNQYGKLINSPIEFVAKGNMQRIASKNGGYAFVDGSSYACAYFSSIVAKQILAEYQNISIGELRKKLIDNANPNIRPLKTTNPNKNVPLVISYDLKEVAESIFDNKNKFPELGRLALFPVSEKEINIFLKTPEFCKYTITKYLDYPKTINTVNSLIKVQDWMLSDSDLDQFDTLVIGYFYEHRFQGNVNFGFEIIKKVLSCNKNIYLFDTNLKAIIVKEYLPINYTGKIYCPIVDWVLFHKIISFKYHRCKTPVLVVVGTSSKQGKFTVQLKMKDILVKEGYKISHISTEPHGELFGAVFSFPMGYNPTVQIPQVKWPVFLRSLSKAIEYYDNPDMILSGIQSWTIPTAFTDESEYAFRSLFYLIGLVPDAIVCSINPNDPIERIQRTISALNLFSRAKILFYAITPIETDYMVNKEKLFVSKQRMLAENELNERIAYYQSQLNTPVLNILDSANNAFIVNSVCNFFS